MKNLVLATPQVILLFNALSDLDFASNLRLQVPLLRDLTLGHCQAGAAYWAMIKTLLGPEIDYPGRDRRGATDLVNSLLNYGYGMLYPRIWRALLLAGLNPHISFLHSFQENKPTLAFDLIEEFRPQVVDRAIFSMLTRGEKLTQVKSGALLTQETRRRVITQVMERLGTLNPYRGHKVSLEEIIRRQAHLLADHLQGRKRYRSFLGRY